MSTLIDPELHLQAPFQVPLPQVRGGALLLVRPAPHGSATYLAWLAMVVGLGFLGWPFVTVILTVLREVNSVPLLAPAFTLVGFSVSLWFSCRHLLWAEERQALGQRLRNFWRRVSLIE